MPAIYGFVSDLIVIYKFQDDFGGETTDLYDDVITPSGDAPRNENSNGNQNEPMEGSEANGDIGMVSFEINIF